jgi:hypothetical protein
MTSNFVIGVEAQITQFAGGMAKQLAATMGQELRFRTLAISARTMTQFGGEL